MGDGRVNICLGIVYFSFLIKIAASFLNIEEITSVNYGIDILNKPVLSGQVASGSVMYLKSRFGQEYQCNLPEVILPSEEARLADDPSATAEVDIAELLRPLEEAPCLVKMKDWWTYEFCYGKFIRQYHMEDNKIISPEIFLGHYESEYDWKNDTKQEENSRNRLQRYHSQYYVNGTRCDVTGTLRRAEVRFLCEEGSGNYIARVDEPESCRYILTIHTAHVCHHPYLRPPPSNKPQPVTCNPVLTAEQYEEYLIEEEESKREAEEQRWKWLAQQEERLEQLKRRKADKQPSDTEEEDKSVDESDDERVLDDDEKTLELIKHAQEWAAESQKRLKAIKDATNSDNILSSSDYKAVSDSQENAGIPYEGNDYDDDDDEDYDDPRAWLRVSKKYNRMVRREERLKPAEVEKAGKQKISRPKHNQLTNKLKRRAESSNPYRSSSSETKKLMGQHQKRLEEYFKNTAEKIPSRYRDDARELEQIDSNDEAETSPAPGAGKVGASAGSSSKEGVATHKTEDTGSEKGVESVKSEKDLETAGSKPLSLEDHFTEIMEEAEEELNENLAKEDGDSFNHLAATLNKLMKKLDRAEQDINQASKTLEKFQQKIDTQSSIGSFPVALKSADIQKAADAETTPGDKEDADELVKVRVSHPGSHNRGKQLQEKAVDESHRHQLEKVIRQKLEQSGLDTTGRKIEVKIITAEYPGNDDDPNVAVLSDEESQQFQHLIITFLAGNQEAAEQMERQQRLEENYRFVWGQGKRKAQVTDVKSEESESKNEESSE